MASEEAKANEPSSQSNGKGKDKALNPPDEPTSTSQGGDSSIVSRVGKSAAGLSKSLLQSKLDANDFNSVATSGKGESSTSRILASDESSSLHSHSEARSTGGFRSAQTASHVAAEESAFSDFLDSTTVFVPMGQVNLETPWQNITHNSTETGPRHYGISSPVQEQQTVDGQEVVDLLSQPEAPPDANEDIRISDAELSNLRTALFTDGNENAAMSSTDWNNALSFIPDFLLWPKGEEQGNSAIHDSSMHLGLHDSAEAGQLWLDQWNRVLTSYNDEVWGDLGALVQEAREEMKQLEEASPEQPPPETKALRRLRQVLSHVRSKL